MSKFKKAALAVMVGSVFAATSAQAAFMSYWFDADGTAGPGSAQLIYEFMDINTGFLGVNSNFVGSTYDFDQYGRAAISGINGGVNADLDASSAAAYNNAKAKYFGSGTGDFSTNTFSFNPSGGKIEFYNPAYTNLIASFDIKSGGGLILASGVPNGTSTMSAGATFFESGYFFRDNAGVQGADFTLSAPYTGADALFGFSTTNVSLITNADQRNTLDGLLSAAYSDAAVQNANGANILDGSNRLTQFYASANGQFRVSDVPEPASLTLVGLGLLGLAFARRRSSK